MSQALEGRKPRFATVTLESGIALRYAERGSPGRTPIVFLHGYTDSWHSFGPVLDELAAGRRAFAPDQRGHGESDKPAGGYEVETFAADAIGFLDALEIERATVVGHSLGSFVAQALTIAHPERVERLVLVGSAATVKSNPGLSEFLRTVAEWSEPPDRALIREFQTSTVHAPIDESFLDAVVAESSKVPLHVWQAALAGLLEAGLTDRLAEIRRPTWVVWGERDALFARSDQDALLQRIPNATLSVYADVGHAPHWERTRAFVADLEQFLEGGIPESAVRDAG